jgi:Ni/Fe-hydrogenase 1 B-type cytochrome subunit
MIQHHEDLREVYVWQLPVRIFHWINAVAIVGLCVTGMLIGHPVAIQHATPPIDNYWFGVVRFTHFVCGFVFIVNFLVRIYWSFCGGNYFARWYQYYPLTKKQWRGIRDTLKVDIFLMTDKPIYDIGHNAMAASTYGVLFIIMALQSITGLMLLAPQSEAFWAPFFKELLVACDGYFPIRDVHHVLMWSCIIFAIIHFYLVFYHDYIEKNGVASSIIGGWKFIPHRIVEDYETEHALMHDIKLLKLQLRHSRRLRDHDHEMAEAARQHPQTDL